MSRTGTEAKHSTSARPKRETALPQWRFFVAFLATFLCCVQALTAQVAKLAVDAELRQASAELYGEPRPGGQERELPRQGTRIWPLPDSQRSGLGPKQAGPTGKQKEYAGDRTFAHAPAVPEPSATPQTGKADGRLARDRHTANGTERGQRSSTGERYR